MIPHSTWPISSEQDPIFHYSVEVNQKNTGAYVTNTLNSDDDDEGTFFGADRRYQSNQRHKGYTSRGYNRSNYKKSSTKGRCWVCKKEDCRSFNHTEEEQREAKAKWRAGLVARDNGDPKTFSRRFAKGFRAYTTECEGDSDEEVTNQISALMVDADSDDDTGPVTKKESIQSTYFTSCGTISIKSATNITEHLSNQAFIHQLLPAFDSLTNASIDVVDTYTAKGISRYGPDAEYHGIMVDTGCSRHSTGGIDQFRALQRFQKLKGLTQSKFDDSTKGSVTVRFGIGDSSSIGSSVLETPIGEVEFHIMPNELPFLLSLADMDRLKVYYNNVTDYIVSPAGKVPVVRRFGHPFLLWNEHLEVFITDSFNNRSNCELTEPELRQLHRRFGHPSALRLKNILERAEYSTVDRNIIDQITKYCEHCQRHSQAPHRFRFTLRDDELRFNNSIIVDVFYINGKPVLHIVDEATRYQAGRWLKDMSARVAWETLRLCWIDTYLGPQIELRLTPAPTSTPKSSNNWLAQSTQRSKSCR